MRLVEGRTDFLNGFIVPKGFVPVPASVAPLAPGGAASEEFEACGKELLLELQVLFGFRSFKKAVAVHRALDACARAGGGGERHYVPDSVGELCRLLGPYVAAMTDIHAVIAMGVVLGRAWAEREDAQSAPGSLLSVPDAHVPEAVGAVVA